MNPLFSIIIATKNEEKNIANCLQSIQKQTYPQEQIEIIVVDNNSSDKTKDIAHQYTDKIFNKGPERSAQKNFGTQQSKGEYCLYLDADMILSPEIIQESVANFKKNAETIALYIPEIVIGNTFWAKVRRFERSFYNATAIDCVRVIKTADFHAIQGFDETLFAAEDWDLDKRIKNQGPTDIIKSPLYHNEKCFTLSSYLKKKKYYSQSFDKYIVKWGEDDSDVKKQFSFYYRFIGVFTENGKWKKIIAHPILTAGMYFLRIMVGITFLLR